MVNASIINFKGIGELAKPAERLIEKVSAGIGVLFEPTRIRRKAKAEADANEIQVRNEIAMDRLLTQAKIKDRELGQRALSRLVQEEIKSQQNMEDVLKGATRYLKEDAEPEKIDDDWLTHVFGKCRAVSNREMQDLWSKILAGEANQAGSFSKRTVEFVSTVSSKEAMSFARLCRHVWLIDKTTVPLVLDVASGVCKRNEVSFRGLTNLDSLGLIHFHGNLGVYVLAELPDLVVASYFGRVFHLNIVGGIKAQMQVGAVLFTPMGEELLRIVEASPIEGMVEETISHWTKEGYTPTPIPEGVRS